jgi:hypothetical protein
VSAVDLELVAFHEAGHSVASVLASIPFEFVTLGGDAVRPGVHFSEAQIPPASFVPSAELIDRHVRVSLAGIAAEEVLGVFATAAKTHVDDMERVRQLAELRCDMAEQRSKDIDCHLDVDGYRAAMLEEVRAELAAKWDAVERVARELEAKGSVTYRRARELVLGRPALTPGPVEGRA